MEEFFVDSSISRERCIAAIQHQQPLDIQGQIACARQGYSGNAAWPRPNPAPMAIDVPQQQIAQATAPTAPLPTVSTTPIPAPRTVYPQIIPAAPTCEGIFDWVEKNPLFAVGALALIFFWRTK